MRKFYLIVSLTTFFTSCDLSQDLEVLISNRTNQDLNIHFVSSIDDSKIVQIKSMSKVFYIEGNGNNSLGGIAFTFAQFDSIYIENLSNEIVKVFKEDTTGKNIYDIDRFWIINDSKSIITYTFEIIEEDLE